MATNTRTTRKTPTVAQLAAQQATQQGQLDEMMGLLRQLTEERVPAATPKVATRKAPARKATPAKAAPAATVKLRAFTRRDRRDFVAAALKEGVDFRHEVTGDDGKTRHPGWTSTEIATYCLANDWCPAGWRIAPGWAARISAAE